MRLKDHDACPLALCNNGNPAVPESNRITANRSWSDLNSSQTWQNTNKYCIGDNLCDNVRSTANLNANALYYTRDSSTEIINADILNNAERISATEEGYRYVNCSNRVPPYVDSEGVIGNAVGVEFYEDKNIYEAGTLEAVQSHGPALSVCSEASPMDSLQEYDDVARSCSSTDASPQDEDDHPFDQSDSEELADANVHPIPRGIINPNYPGFQHLAHTLEDYPLNICNSALDADYTDEDLDTNHTEPNIIIGDTDDNYFEHFLEHELNMQHTNNDDNNNNNEGEENYTFNYVKRLQSIENIKSILYDKPVLNIVVNDKENNINIANEISQTIEADVAMCKYSESNIAHSQSKLNDLKSNTIDPVADNDASQVGNYIRSISTADIIGDFGKEIEHEIGEIVRRNSNFQDDLFALQQDIHDVIQKPLEETINNISDVVNRVIERIVINQAVDGYQQWLQPVNKPLGTEKYIPSEDSVDSNDDLNISVNSSEEIASNVIENISDNTVSNFKNDIIVNENVDFIFDDISSKMADAFLSNAKDVINAHSVNIKDNIINFSEQSCKVCDVDETLNSLNEQLLDEVNPVQESVTGMNSSLSVYDNDNNLNEKSEKISKEKKAKPKVQVVKPLIANKEEINTMLLEKDIDHTVLRKKEKSDSRTHYTKKIRRESMSNSVCSGGVRPRDNLNRRSLPVPSKKNRGDSIGLFDVYNIETAMPNIDLDAIENHLRAAKEEERRRRNDREEIRRRLAMGTEQDDYYTPTERPGRKPSLQSRLQSGMNLQICFMNETASDTESPGSDTEAKTPKTPNFSSLTDRLNDDVFSKYNFNHPYQTKPLSVNINQATSDTYKQKTGCVRPSSLSLSSLPINTSLSTEPLTEADFFAKQARLQAEARMALAQAKEMARVQMEIERQKQQISPITEMLRLSLQKAGIPLSSDRRRVSRQLLTDMNVAQLQIIVNELHTQIENLNEQLVKLLMARDELHMGQDSMLVDIEDLTRYLGAKEQSIKPTSAISSSNTPAVAPAPVLSTVHRNSSYSSPVSSLLTAPAAALRPKLHRIASLVKK